MAQISKRTKALRGKIDRDKTYPIADALKLVKEGASAKFNESVDVAINLGIDAKKSDQVVRGSIVLPKGTGKSVRVAVFAQGEKAEAADLMGAMDFPTTRRYIEDITARHRYYLKRGRM